jgi:hypothetical protein
MRFFVLGTGAMGNIFDEWRPGALLIEALRFCGVVLFIGGIVFLFLGALGGSPDRLYETRFNFDLIDQSVGYALAGAALWLASWGLRRWWLQAAGDL